MGEGARTTQGLTIYETGKDFLIFYFFKSAFSSRSSLFIRLSIYNARFLKYPFFSSLPFENLSRCLLTIESFKWCNYQSINKKIHLVLFPICPVIQIPKEPNINENMYHKNHTQRGQLYDVDKFKS